MMGLTCSQELGRLRSLSQRPLEATSNGVAHQTHQTTQSTTVAPSHDTTAEFRLHKKLHDGHCGPINCILLAALRTATVLIKQTRCLGHGNTDEVCLRLSTTTTTRGELLQDLRESLITATLSDYNCKYYLQRRRTTERTGGKRLRLLGVAMVSLPISTLDALLIDGAYVLLLLSITFRTVLD